MYVFLPGSRFIVSTQWQPGEDGYVHWYGDGEFRFGIEQAGLDPYKTKIPTEPSYVIINTAISTSWGFPSAPIGCTEYDCKTETGRCGFSPGFCKTLPAEFKIAHVRVYQNKNDSNMYVGCNPRSHPTKRYIAAHPEKYTLPGAAHPLKEVVAGGGRCTGHKDCGKTGTCGTFGRCKCSEDFTGPHCLVRFCKVAQTFVIIIYYLIYGASCVNYLMLAFSSICVAAL